ncbi:MAG: type I phosphomannose isomerase catalytic subunit [Clostridiaceae bacterium]|nr:type I phosphomannose isomerase catalytic subunit [Clostridiaceae bacterium]
MLYPLRFRPVYKDYLWGGRALASFGKILPSTGIVAESWEISAHHNGISVIANGSLAGASLPDVVRTFGRSLLGNAAADRDLAKFPLLIKLIDARERLSVQVHPDDLYALRHENGEYGKNEMWYVVAAQPGARLVAGLKPGICRADFTEAIARGHCLDCLQTISVQAGDAVNIPAGLVHAIGGGLVICEIQQNSDTTYRVYDYDRRDSEGKTRPLHIDKALDVIDFSRPPQTPLISGLIIRQGGLTRRILVLNRYFMVEEQQIKNSADFLSDGRRFSTLTVLQGQGSLSFTHDSSIAITEPLFPGDSLLIPASLGSWQIRGDLTMIVSRPADYAADLANLAGLAHMAETAELAGSGLIALDPKPEPA